MSPGPRFLVVFDLDDTLYLERTFVRSGFRVVSECVRREWGVSGFFSKAWRLFLAGERRLIVDRVIQDEGIQPFRAVVRRLVAVYRSHRPRLRLCPDARRFVERPPPGVALAILTDGRPRTQRAKIRALGLDRWIDPVILTGRWGTKYGKPHPRGFRTLQRRFGLRPSACVYVADNPAKDFDAPRRLGWRFVRMRRPGGLYGHRLSPDVQDVRSCYDLRRWLELEADFGGGSRYHGGAPAVAARARRIASTHALPAPPRSGGRRNVGPST
ncbi:MAG: HAD family hydrolase [Planctomycetes bacterium]|nr:HAD family hydrolase [Planctomycetota bacterium]